jgi:hypothetical protein
MRIPAGLSRILTEIAPERINDGTELILDVLFKINTVLREINSIDFCNPLGYILTKAMPPDGLLEGKLLKFGTSITKFVNDIENKLTPGKLPGETDEQYRARLLSYQSALEEIRLALEDIVPPDDLVDIIPGGGGIVKTIQQLNLALVATSDTIGTAADPTQLIITKVTLLRSFARKLTPFMSPINIANNIISRDAEELNKKLAGIIQPQRFKESVRFLVRQVQTVDRVITQIQKIVKLMNSILKIINVLIKVYKFIKKVLKRLIIPTAIIPPLTGGVGVPMGALNTQSDTLSTATVFINDLEKLIDTISGFLSGVVLLEIGRIRKEILRILTGLNILYKNLRDCNYTSGDTGDTGLLDIVQGGITSLTNSLATLDELFPTAQYGNAVLPSVYNGYTIDIIKEEVVDEGISLLRRRVIVADQRGVIQYEGKGTYATDDQVLIKEGQFYINKQGQTGTSDQGNDSPTDQDITDIVTQIGYNPNSTIEGPVTPD